MSFQLHIRADPHDEASPFPQKMATKHRDTFARNRTLGRLFLFLSDTPAAFTRSATVLEKKCHMYRYIVNIGGPCGQLPLWSSWLRRLIVNRFVVGSNAVSVITFLFLSFTFMVKIMLSHPLLYAWRTCGATLTKTL